VPFVAPAFTSPVPFAVVRAVAAAVSPAVDRVAAACSVAGAVRKDAAGFPLAASPTSIPATDAAISAVPVDAAVDAVATVSDAVVDALV